MIEELHIRGLGVIEDATLRLAPGLTVVSGETGAGKTMLVTALGLLTGDRADTTLVRHQAPVASVEAIICPVPPEATEWIADQDEVLVVSREIPVEGRSRARIGGRLAPVSALTEVLGGHIEIHAQHEHVRLARPDVQRDLLDRYAGETHARTLAAYRECYDTWRALAERHASAASDARERARELDRLRAEVEEIGAAALDPERDAALDRDIDRLANAEEIARGSATASLALGSEGALEPVGIALDALRRLPVEDPALEDLRDRAAALAAELSELAADVRAYGEVSEADPARLAALQDRKRTITALTRKYGVDVAAVLAWAEEAAVRVAQLEADESDADALDARLAEAAGRLAQVGEDLRRGRRLAAAHLAEVVDAHLAELGMPHARFQAEVEPLESGVPAAHGADRVRFLLAANPGEPARSIATAASGGERSRVSLAIEVALADVDDARVLVFDEVDAGIGGATAMAVGRKLARLASTEGRPRQVLCVTHLAQLAAFADVHHVVEKGVAGGRTVTTVRRISEQERAPELSRMLGGDPTAQAGLEHARELLDQARRRAAG